MKVPDLEGVFEGVLDFMEVPGSIEWNGAYLGQRVKPMWFNGAEPLVDQMHPLYDALGYEIFTDATPDALDGMLDTSIIVNNHDEGGYQLQRFREVHPHELRGRARTLLPYMYDYTSVWVQNGRKTHALRYFIGGRGNGNQRWFMLNEDGRFGGAEQNIQFGRALQHTLGYAFTKRYFWMVRLGYVGHPSVRIPTDEAGVRETFRLRDIPEGRERRAALKHWVSDHWRQRRSEPGDASYVREHMRGTQDFVWNGLRCVIEPSRFDLERDTELRALRKEQRTKRDEPIEIARSVR